MSRAWRKHPERGSGFLIRLIRWIALHVGYPAARVFLYPISAYFVCKATSNRRASLQFFTRLRGRPAHWGHVFRHIHCFSSTILDRVFFLSNRFASYDIQVHGMEIPHRLADAGRGAIMLGTHLGSFEVLRAMDKRYREVPFKILMYREQNQMMNEILEAIDPKISTTVIDLGSPDSLLITRNYLEKGYFVGMLGDRVVKDEQSIECDFLGHPARLPLGPLQVAAMMGVPVVLFFGLYMGSKKYAIHFELLAEKVDMQRHQRAASLKPYLQQMMRRMEHYARLAPYNWFNFYDYWKD